MAKGIGLQISECRMQIVDCGMPAKKTKYERQRI